MSLWTQTQGFFFLQRTTDEQLSAGLLHDVQHEPSPELAPLLVFGFFGFFGVPLFSTHQAFVFFAGVVPAQDHGGLGGVASGQRGPDDRGICRGGPAVQGKGPGTPVLLLTA